MSGKRAKAPAASRRLAIAENACAKAEFLIEQRTLDPVDEASNSFGALRNLLIAVRALAGEVAETTELAAELRKRFPK